MHVADRMVLGERRFRINRGSEFGCPIKLKCQYTKQHTDKVNARLTPGVFPRALGSSIIKSWDTILNSVHNRHSQGMSREFLIRGDHYICLMSWARVVPQMLIWGAITIWSPKQINIWPEKSSLSSCHRPRFILPLLCHPIHYVLLHPSSGIRDIVCNLLIRTCVCYLSSWSLNFKVFELVFRIFRSSIPVAVLVYNS